MIEIIIGIIVVILVSSLRIINEYERGVKFTLGRYSNTMQPGLRIVIPIIQTYKKVDIRTKLDKYNRKRSFPTIVINDGHKVIIGFFEDELKEALKI